MTKGKKVVQGVDAVDLGLLTRADVDAFSEWVNDGTDDHLRSLEGTLLRKEFFGELQTPRVWVTSEVIFPPLPCLGYSGKWLRL